MKDRFAKLVALTRGAAVITLSAGAGASACSKNDPPPIPPMTAESAATPASVATDSPVPDAGGAPFVRRFPTPNAMHRGVGRAPESGTDSGP
jgi:hypothetical protein